VGLVSQGVVDSPAGGNVAHGQGEAEFPRRIAPIVLYQVDLEESGGLGGAFEMRQNRDELPEGRAGPRSAGSPDTQRLFVFFQKPLYRRGAYVPQLVPNFPAHGAGRVGGDTSDVQVQEGGEDFRALAVKSLPEAYEGLPDGFVVDSRVI
jgi:hypothetical protein